MHRRGEGDEWYVRGVWWYMGEGRVISGVWCVGGVREMSGRGGQTQLNFTN